MKMIRSCPVILLLVTFGIWVKAQDGLIIQENSPGVCTMDGIVENSAEGYTGEGYANIDNGTGIGMSWSFSVGSAGNYSIYWRYALGGSDTTSRDARLLLDNIFTSDTVRFPHSGSSSWAVWICTDTLDLFLEAGNHMINLVSITEKGLSNLDYFHILGENIEPAACVPSFTFRIGINDSLAGSVDYMPKQELYAQGTEITLTAMANEGYFFHSWSGPAASVEAEHTFPIQTNTEMTALFYPEGTTTDPGARGYAVIQHDNGTPYLLTGGSAGETVRPENLQQLKYYLEAKEPYVVELDMHLQGDNTEEISIASNKTLTGIDPGAHIEGMPLKINGSRNVIIRNITFSMVVQYDEIEINGGSRNIWIDHCDFYTDRDHELDYYDGLLDIKNLSRFITVSWCAFHDHQKSILISSGDQETADSVIRITFHHNYFFDCDSRLPSIRFGRAHIFNNYYRDNGTAINSRMGACVRVENNYFENTGTAVGMLYSPEPGSVDLTGNIFNDCGFSEEPACTLDVPYDYLDILHPADQIPDTVTLGTGHENPESIQRDMSGIPQIILFPNPATGRISLSGRNASSVYQVKVTDVSGRPVGQFIVDGNPEFDISSMKPGLYLFYLTSNEAEIVKKAVLY